MTAAPIYHEKQHLARCAVHALNNLLQEEAFNANLLDDIGVFTCLSFVCGMSPPIAHNLTPGNVLALNPHKSVLGIGNYDLNVIEKALDSIGLWCAPKYIHHSENMHHRMLTYAFVANRPQVFFAG